MYNSSLSQKAESAHSSFLPALIYLSRLAVKEVKLHRSFLLFWGKQGEFDRPPQETLNIAAFRKTNLYYPELLKWETSPMNRSRLVNLSWTPTLTPSLQSDLRREIMTSPRERVQSIVGRSVDESVKNFKNGSFHNVAAPFPFKPHLVSKLKCIQTSIPT